MAALLRIPEQYESGLAKIKGLSESDVEQVLHALQGSSVTNTREDLSSLIKRALPSFSSDDIKALVEALRSLYLARASADIKLNRFVSELVAAIRESGNRELQTTDPNELTRLKKTLTDLLNVRPLSLMSKAHGLQADFENIFCDAKMITDIRPVFDGDVKEAPTGVVITHTLKIEYHHAGQHTVIHMAMDKRDIEALITVIKRAQNKATTLSEMIAKCELDLLAE